MKKGILTTTFITGLILLGLNINNANAADFENTQNNQSTQSTENNNSSIYVDPTASHPRLKDVNGYINQNKLQFSGVKDETAQSTFTAGKAYRHGTPEGIVVHETNKPNISAQEWANMFNQNWKTNQTYVHAFVDKDQVVQIAPTNKTVWGAGYYANQRFIQVELCEENTEKDFAQSIQNDATYIAQLLHQYNLKPSLADGKGNGTIWSHHDVTKYLGNTNHTDPDDYFAWHNYSMQQFFNLIKQRYDEMAPLYNKNNVIDQKGIGQVRYNGKGKVAIWSSPNSSHKIIKYVSKNTSWKFFKVAKINGHVWYNLGGNQWIDGSYLVKK